MTTATLTIEESELLQGDPLDGKHSHLCEAIVDGDDSRLSCDCQNYVDQFFRVQAIANKLFAQLDHVEIK